MARRALHVSWVPNHGHQNSCSGVDSPRPRYRLRDLLSSDKNNEDKERVRVEHYKHDRSFKERLRFYFVNNQQYSVRWQMFRFLMKIVSCILYVVRSIQDNEPDKAHWYGCTDEDLLNGTKWCCGLKPNISTDYNICSFFWVQRPDVLWIVQTIIAFYSFTDTMLHCYLSKRSLISQIVNITMFIEIILSVPFIISIFLPEIRNIWIPLFLNCWLAKATLETMFNDLHRLVLRQQSALSQKLLILTGTVFCILFTSVCGIHHIERGSQQWPFFDVLWFVVVTFSTVGYGDCVPEHWTSQTFVMLMIVVALIKLPIELEQLAFLLYSRQKEGGAYSTLLAGTTRHVVLCCTTLRTVTLIDFLNEFYADPKLQDVQVVLLCPSELDSTLRILLQVPVWAQRVTYLKGSALINEDLVRARVETAAGCFILGDRYADDREAADQHTILRTWAVQDFAPATKLYVQILKPENKFHVSFAEFVVCEDEIKHALLASNCVCPGISTFVTLLLHTLHEQEGSEKWHDTYGRCAGNEIYDIRLGESLIFRPYAYKSFTHAAFHAHKKYGVTLIGVRRSGKNSRVILNPGPSHTMNYDDQCFYIAISSEEDTAFKKYEEPKKKRRLNSQKLRNQSFITASSVALELHSEGFSDSDRYGDVAESNRLKQLQQHPGNGVKYTASARIELEVETPTDSNDNVDATTSNAPDEVDNQEVSDSSGEVGEVLTTTKSKEVTFDIGESDEVRRSSSPFVPDESDMESEVGMEIEDMPSRIPNYRIGVLPVSPYIGRTPVRCHLLKIPKPHCCLRLYQDCPHRDTTDHHRIQQQQGGGIIVASPVAEAGLYNFILPLRAYHRPKITLKPIILLLGEEPNSDFLEAVCHFPMLYYVTGSINCLDNLLQAGCLTADSIVVVGQRNATPFYDEEHMADASTIVGVQTIYRLFPAATLIVELTHASNMRFMKFQADQVNFSNESMASLRESVKRKLKEQNKKDHLNYMFREPFAAGFVFSMSMLDTLLYQTFVKDYMISLISLLLGCEQAPGSGYLCSFKITSDHLWLETYGRLFQRLCSTTCEIPIGVYRTEIGQGEDVEDSCPRGTKFEKRDILEIIGNRMKQLGLQEHQQEPKRSGVSFVIVNPIPEFSLIEGDIIYLIRPTNTTPSTPASTPGSGPETRFDAHLIVEDATTSRRSDYTTEL